MDTLSGETTLLELFLLLPISKGVSSESGEFAPFGRKFFTFRVDPLSDEV